MDITKAQRNTILTKIEAIVSEKYFDPAFDNAAWNATVSRHRSTIVESGNTEAFEKAVGAMLAELSPKTLGLLSDRTPINPRNAINASFSIQTISEALRWVFQDVLPRRSCRKSRRAPRRCSADRSREVDDAAGSIGG